jgi:hypothetical protein
MLIAALIAMAVPAAAQDAQLPRWMLGNWCMKNSDMHQCIRVEDAADGGLAVSVIYPDSPQADRVGSVGWMRIVDGRLVSHSEGAGTTYREVSHRPGELLLERTGGAGAPQIRYRVRGTTLTVYFGNGKALAQVYQLTP